RPHSLLLLPFLDMLPPPREIYSLPLHDALPIFNDVETLRRCADELIGGPVGAIAAMHGGSIELVDVSVGDEERRVDVTMKGACRDRKSTRLNSSHVSKSYAVFCLKNKTNDRTAA